MRLSVALCALLLVCVSFASGAEFDVNSIKIPSPPSFVDMGVDAEAEETASVDDALNVDTDVSHMFEQDLASFNAGAEDINAHFGSLNKGSGGLDNDDWNNLPSDKQVPGDLVRLLNAPGAVPNMSEEILPRELLPTPDCPNEQHIADVKLWKAVTKKIRSARTTLSKYKRWLWVANRAVKNVIAQIRQTENNSKLLNKAIGGMTKHRKDIIKRLKAYKLQNKLRKAEEKMEQLQKFGMELAVARAKATGGNEDLVNRIKLLKKGYAELQKEGEDA